MSSGALLPAPGEGESTVYRPCWALRGLWSVLGSPLRLLRRLFPGRTGSCVFCAVSQEKGFNVVLEDAQFVAFHDRSPAARVHLLVVPRKHWGNVAHWPATEESAARARAMHTFGQRALRLALEQQSGTDIEANLALPSDEKDWYDPDAGAFQRFGFHVRPLRRPTHNLTRLTRERFCMCVCVLTAAVRRCAAAPVPLSRACTPALPRPPLPQSLARSQVLCVGQARPRQGMGLVCHLGPSSRALGAGQSCPVGCVLSLSAEPLVLSPQSAILSAHCTHAPLLANLDNTSSICGYRCSPRAGRAQDMQIQTVWMGHWSAGITRGGERGG